VASSTNSKDATAAEHLLAAVSKVQQLVEQLSGSEPSAAADLSLLQWQLTSLYGCLSAMQQLPCSDTTSVAVSSSSSQPCGVLMGVSCFEDPLSARVSTTAVAAAPPASATAATIEVAADTAAAQPACGEDLAAAAQQQQQQHCARLTAAAQYFSGAAAVADSCSSSSSSSSRKPLPPASHASFQPLGQLLAQVQEGRGYVPCQPGGPGTAAAVQKKRDRPQQVHMLPVSTHSSCGGGALAAEQPGCLGQLHSAVSAAAAGGSSPGASQGRPGGGVLEEAMRWWVNMAATAAQLPGPTSVVDILDRVVSSLTAAATPVHPAVHALQAGEPQASAPGRRE
jgi:hypothetical protein